MIEQLHFHFSLSCIGEGNGNPLQCSCLQNPRDRGAWWAAVYGVAQSRTQLEWLSSSNSRRHVEKNFTIIIFVINIWKHLTCLQQNKYQVITVHTYLQCKKIITCSKGLKTCLGMQKQPKLVAREGKSIHKSFKCISTKLGLTENTQKIFQQLAKYIFLYILYFYNFNRSKNTYELSCKCGREAWGSWNRMNTT